MLVSLRRFFSAPNVDNDEETNRRAVLLSFLINLHIAVGLGTATLLALFTDIPSIFPMTAFISILPGVGMRVLMHRGRVTLAATLFLAMIFLLMPGVAWAGGSSVAVVSVTVFQAITIVMSGLLLGGRGVVVFVALTGLVNGVFIYAELNGWYEVDTSRDLLSIWFMQVISFSAIAAMLILTNRFIRDSFTRARASEKRYRALLENIPVVTYLVGAVGEPSSTSPYASPQVEKISGYTSDEFLNDPHFWAKLIHPEDKARAMAESDRADETGAPFISDYRIITKDGKTLWFHDESVVVRDEQGHPLYRIGVWNDITARKQAELALQELEDMYRRAIDAAGAVPYVIGHGGGWSYLFLGDGIHDLTGYTAAEMTSELWDSLRLDARPRGRLAHLSFDEADRLTNEDISVLWECDFQIRARDGTVRWISDSSVKRLDEKSGRLVSIGIYQDITERKQIEYRMQQLNEELERRVQERTHQLEAANRELESFSYSVSHDLRAPLRAIISFSRIIQMDFAESLAPEGRAYLERVMSSGDKLNQLIEELLSFSRIARHQLEKRPVDVNALVREVIDMFAAEIDGRRIDWVIADLPPALGDLVLLRQVYANLVGNAIKYSRLRDPARIEIGARQEQGVTVYFVRDNGAGFDMNYYNKLFGVFQRLHSESEFEGTGIGLVTVQRIVERHGGRVWAEAEVDKGATFYFTLA